MKPDTYKPTLSVQVLPRSKEDQFVPGEKYSPRTGGNSATTTTALTIAMLLPVAAMSYASLGGMLIQI